MRKLRLAVSLFSVCMLFGGEALWATAAAGRITAPFLKIPMGVRATGMGEAFTGVADDDQAMYYNPSGLALIDRPTVALMHLQGFGGVNYEYFALVSPSSLFGIDIWGSVGLSYSLLSIQPTDLTRALPDGSFDTNQAAKNQTWSAGGSVLGLAWGWMVNETVGVGAELKIINQQVAEVTQTMVAVDVGATTFFPGLPGAQLGIDLQNLGPEGDEAPLPSRVRAGASYTADFGSGDKHHWIFSSDAALPLGPSDEALRFSFGSELAFDIGGHRVAMRGGYRLPTDLGSRAGMTLGGGLGLNILGTEVGLDYAYVPFGILGNTHRMGITSRFGKSTKKEMPKKKVKRRKKVKGPEELLPPLRLQGSAGSRKARMFWIPTGQEGVAGYNIYLAYKPKGPWFKLNKSPIKGTAQVVGSLFNNVTTYFVATAVDDDGRESRRSNMASVQPRKGGSISRPTGVPGENELGDERKSTLPALP